jgi:hypothetical protein
MNVVMLLNISNNRKNKNKEKNTTQLEQEQNNNQQYNEQVGGIWQYIIIDANHEYR